jgi:hypothetical protein
VEADWGIDQPPRWSGAAGSLLGPVVGDDPRALPEVAEAVEAGWTLAPEAPLWCFLPAVWPRDDRAWVRDRRARHLLEQCEGQPTRRLPWSAADHADLELDTNALLSELGLPPRPAGRIWLLRLPPTASLTVDQLLARTWSAWVDAGEPAMATAPFVAHCHRAIRSLG